jgi:hypothetical protein
MTQKLWTLLGTDQGLLVGGFILTTIAGGVITFIFQQLSWRKEMRINLYQQKYRDGIELLAKLSTMVDTRFFALQRFTWALQERDENRIAAREKEYFESVVQWNQSLRSMHNGLRLLVGEEEALGFLDYADDQRQEQPSSLHYQFVAAHRTVMKAKANPNEVRLAEDIVERLNWSLSRFISGITTEFDRRAETLSLLRVPPVGRKEGRFLPRAPSA